MNQRERLETARSGAAVSPVLSRGVVRVTGKDRQDYLHRMSTQNVNALAPGGSAYSAFLDAKGHLVGEGMIVVRPDEILLDLDPAAAAETKAHLERFVIMDDVVLADASAELRVVAALGPSGIARAREVAAGAIASEDPRRGAPSLDLYLTPPEAERVRAALAAAGAVALEPADLEALRILAGIPRFGADMDRSRLPMEAGLTRAAIKFDKGCYLGQEVVLRATVRGHLQRGLVQLALPAEAAPGAKLRAGADEVGIVTSAADTPEGRIGLGYVRRAHWKSGDRLETDGGEAVVREVLVHEGTC